MRKIQWMPLVCALVIGLSGCIGSPTKSTQPPSDAIQVDGSTYIEEYAPLLQYQHLTDDEKICYGQVYTALRDYGLDETFIHNANGQAYPGLRISITEVELAKESLSRVFEAILHDNPQFFYLHRTYSLEGHEIHGQSVYDTLVLQYTMEAAQRNAAAQELDSVVTDILNSSPNTDDEYEIERYLHDRVLEICSYDDQAAASSSQQYADAYSAYGALVKGKAVCEGYAKAMQLVLNRSGISTTVVLGESVEDGIAHMWNLVNINGAYYYLDATWNDNEQQPQYAYFNITTEQLQRTHLIAEQLYVEICTAQTDNYYIRNNTYLDSFDRDDIAETIANRIMAGDTTIHLQFGEGKFENALLFLKNATLTQKMVNSHLSDETMWHYELHIFSDQNIITIKKV